MEASGGGSRTRFGTFFRPQSATAVAAQQEKKLYEATLKGDAVIVSSLLAEKCDPNGGARGEPPLVHACLKGHVTVVEAIFSSAAAAGNSVLLGKPSISLGVTAVSAACQSGCIRALQILLAKEADPNMRCGSGLLPPLVTATQAGHKEAVISLLASKAFVNLADKEGRTALWEAAFKGNTEIVDVLLEAKADCSLARTRSGSAPLHVACYFGSEAVVSMLLDAGAPFNAQNRQGFSPLHMAAWRNNVGIVKKLCAQPGIQLRLQTRQTPLDMAKFFDQPLIVTALEKATAKRELAHAQQQPTNSFSGAAIIAHNESHSQTSSSSSSSFLTPSPSTMSLSDSCGDGSSNSKKQQSQDSDFPRKCALAALENWIIDATKRLDCPKPSFPGIVWSRDEKQDDEDEDALASSSSYYSIIEALPPGMATSPLCRPGPPGLRFKIQHRRLQRQFILQCRQYSTTEEDATALTRECNLLRLLSHHSILPLVHHFIAPASHFKKYNNSEEAFCQKKTTAVDDEIPADTGHDQSVASDRVFCAVFLFSFDTRLDVFLHSVGSVSEKDAMFYTLQLLQAVDYLTTNRIAHPSICISCIFVRGRHLVLSGVAEARFLDDPVTGKPLGDDEVISMFRVSGHHVPPECEPIAAASLFPSSSSRQQQSPSSTNVAVSSSGSNSSGCTIAMRAEVYAVACVLQAVTTGDMSTVLLGPFFPRIDKSHYSKLTQATIDAFSSEVSNRPSAKVAIAVAQWILFVPQEVKCIPTVETTARWLHRQQLDRGAAASLGKLSLECEVEQLLEAEFFLRANAQLLVRIAEKFRREGALPAARARGRSTFSLFV